MFLSYAQNFEDVYIHRLFPNLLDGTYVDVGAFSPEIDSVTKAFYDLGWRGLNIEPVVEYWESFCEKRPDDTNLNIAVSSSSHQMPLFEVKTSGLSSFSPENAALAGKTYGFDVQSVIVQCETLDSIWQRYLGDRPVHFLKIDVEGAELMVLQGAPETLRTQRPMVLIIESIAPITRLPNADTWEHLVLDAGYKYSMFDGVNNWYLSPAMYEKHGDVLQIPVHYFDDFAAGGLTNKIDSLERKLARVERELASSELEKETEKSAALTELEKLQGELLGLVEQNRELSSQAKHANDQFAAVLNSATWRLSRPFRNVVDWSRARKRTRG
jgi:FkbM family methyltransferase